MSDNIKILRNYLLYFLLLLLVCIVGISNVFAYTYEDIGYFNNNSDVHVEVSYNAQPIQIPINEVNYVTNVYSLDIDITNINLTQDYVYWFEIYLPQTNSINANQAQILWYGDNNASGSCTILTTYFANKYPHVTFKCNGSTNIRQLFIKYYNTDNSYIIDSNYFTWNYTYMRRRTPDNNDNTGTITDSIQKNAEDIISNQNQNTQDIINNQNQNTQQQIESQKVCDYVDKNNVIVTNKLLNSQGVEVYSINWGITDYIKIEKSDIKVLKKSGSNNSYLCFYDINKTKLSCVSNNSLTDNELIDFPNNTSYIRFSISMSSNQPQLQICKNGNQALNDSITGLNDSLNDDDSSGASSEASEFFSSFTTNTFGLTSIITAPLNLIQSLTSSTCSELHLPLPYLNNKYLDLPCMTSIYQSHFGAFFTMYQTITYGIIAYWVCVRIFNQVKDFKNPEHDEIEVVDL